MIGDQGFDPLGITNTIPSLNYVRAAELKHGRVAMLAVLGWHVDPPATKKAVHAPTVSVALGATHAH